MNFKIRLNKGIHILFLNSLLNNIFFFFNLSNLPFVINYLRNKILFTLIVHLFDHLIFLFSCLVLSLH